MGLCNIFAFIGIFALLLLGVLILIYILASLWAFYERYEERKDLLNRLEDRTNERDQAYSKLDRTVFREEGLRYGIFGRNRIRTNRIKESQDKIEELELTIVDLNDRICDLEKRRK